jgi:hypothetical protein
MKCIVAFQNGQLRLVKQTEKIPNTKEVHCVLKKHNNLTEINLHNGTSFVIRNNDVALFVKK